MTVSRHSYALISSHRTTGILLPDKLPRRFSCFPIYATLDAAVKPLGSHGDNLEADLYIAMDPDLRRLARLHDIEPPRERPCLAAEVLGSIPLNSARQIAATIHRELRSHSPGRVIVALATYLPELARDEGTNSGMRELAINALALVLAIGAELRSSTLGHRVCVVETVAGSRFSKLRASPRGTNAAELDFHVTLSKPEESIGRFLESVREAIRIVANIPKRQLPSIAVELEPGPCFALNSLASLRTMAKLIGNDATLSERVGFNLDIAHWRIAGITIPQVQGSKDVMSRILHAHVSGHHPCSHFGDCLPDRVQWRELRNWIAFYRSLGNANQRPPNFSGCVSVELESCNNDRLVREFFKQLGVAMK